MTPTKPPSEVPSASRVPRDQTAHIRDLLSQNVPVYCIHNQTDAPIAEIESIKTKLEYESKLLSTMRNIKAKLAVKKDKNPWRKKRPTKVRMAK